MKTKRPVSLTAMLKRSDADVPPKSPVAAAAWRKKRLAERAQADAERERYEQIMAEKRRAEGRGRTD